MSSSVFPRHPIIQLAACFSDENTCPGMLVLYPAHLHKGLLPFILRKWAGYKITDILV